MATQKIMNSPVEMDPVTTLMSSEAGKEAQKFIGKAGGSLIGDILQYSEWGINQRLRLLENQINAVQRVKVLCERTGFRFKQVNLKVLLPYLEGVSMEEEPRLQELWANLMVNYLDADKNLTSHVFPGILKQLSSDDIEILTYCAEKGRIAIGVLDREAIFRDKNISVANLERLSLIRAKIQIEAKRNKLRAAARYGGTSERDSIGDIDIKEVDSGLYFLTTFGRELLFACGVVDDNGKVLISNKAVD